jgi:hypothetical protein
VCCRAASAKEQSLTRGLLRCAGGAQGSRQEQRGVSVHACMNSHCIASLLLSPMVVRLCRLLCAAAGVHLSGLHCSGCAHQEQGLGGTPTGITGEAARSSFSAAKPCACSSTAVRTSELHQTILLMP